MLTSQSKRNAIGPRLLAGTLLGLTLILMVVAGMNTRADSANEIAVRAIDGNDLVKSNPDADLTQAQQKKAEPPQAPEPPQEPQPPEAMEASPPTQPNPPSKANQPAQPAQASQPAQTTQPDEPLPPSPPSSMTAPSSPPPPPPRPVNDQDKPSTRTEKEESGKQGKREVIKGELIEAPQPIYPEEAKKQKIEGMVTVGIVIDEDGKVISAKVVSGHQLLHDASKDAAFKARFKPTTVNGKPAKVSGAMTYNFVLDKK